ncbi:MAG TPA: hypothetical protein VE860_17235 [Chthoniobacterales bacterium]|jgi:hypothetical protein|nr:hypothetical protein [Chthoniobacterales bacterium]
MNKAILVFSFGILLSGCAATDDSNDTVSQTPRFGKPESSIPWNQPTDWEKSGQLGQMPGMDQPH